jgi:hypothetical protein
MKEHPILYSKQMIQAKLNGRKFVTRRPMKPQPVLNFIGDSIDGRMPVDEDFEEIHCPYGQAGDRLWTKENFQIIDEVESSQEVAVVYQADQALRHVRLTDGEWEKFQNWKYPHRKKSKLFMFRSLSRFLDEITEINVEQVQDITPHRAWNEGIRIRQGGGVVPVGRSHASDQFYINEFKKLWQSMYKGDVFDWKENPWLWVIRYRTLFLDKAGNQDLVICE